MSKDDHILSHDYSFLLSEPLHVPFLPPGAPFHPSSLRMKCSPSLKTVTSAVDFFPSQLDGLIPLLNPNSFSIESRLILPFKIVFCTLSVTPPPLGSVLAPETHRLAGSCFWNLWVQSHWGLLHSRYATNYLLIGLYFTVFVYL